MSKGRKYRKAIPRIEKIKEEKNSTRNIKNLKIVKRNTKEMQALSLPTICNLNPRSVYNKADEFHAFVEQEEVDLLLMSESWEREYLTLDEIINLEDHTIISNVSQRKGMGGRPAIFANNPRIKNKGP